jgi:hypothetical protein
MASDHVLASPRLLGYWRELLPEGAEPWMSQQQAEHWELLRQQGLRWPDPVRFVDPAWAGEERTVVIRHLSIGVLVNQYRGLSRCRFCGSLNGSAELMDGAYCWPEGLAHYVSEHQVRPPADFVAHTMAAARTSADLPVPAFDAYGQRARDWPGRRAVELLWLPSEPDDGANVQVHPDAGWWLEQH